MNKSISVAASRCGKHFIDAGRGFGSGVVNDHRDDDEFDIVHYYFAADNSEVVSLIGINST